MLKFIMSITQVVKLDFKLLRYHVFHFWFVTFLCVWWDYLFRLNIQILLELVGLSVVLVTTISIYFGMSMGTFQYVLDHFWFHGVAIDGGCVHWGVMRELREILIVLKALFRYPGLSENFLCVLLGKALHRGLVSDESLWSCVCHMRSLGVLRLLWLRSKN